MLAIHVFRCTLYHGGDAFGARGSPTWQFHQNLMYSFIVTSKLCLFADNWDVYQGPGGRESRQANADRFLIIQVVAPAPAGHVTPARSPVEHEPAEYDKVSVISLTLFLPPLSLSAYLDVCLYFFFLCVQCCDKHHMCSA